ncbi:MAG: hypothetical protein ACI9BD_001334, partial [Candidatus Marinamargulisbacteria bacterium]
MKHLNGELLLTQCMARVLGEVFAGERSGPNAALILPKPSQNTDKALPVLDLLSELKPDQPPAESRVSKWIQKWSGATPTPSPLPQLNSFGNLDAYTHLFSPASVVSILKRNPEKLISSFPRYALQKNAKQKLKKIRLHFESLDGFLDATPIPLEKEKALLTQLIRDCGGAQIFPIQLLFKRYTQVISFLSDTTADILEKESQQANGKLSPTHAQALGNATEDCTALFKSIEDILEIAPTLFELYTDCQLVAYSLLTLMASNSNQTSDLKKFTGHQKQVTGHALDPMISGQLPFKKNLERVQKALTQLIDILGNSNKSDDRNIINSRHNLESLLQSTLKKIDLITSVCQTRSQRVFSEHLQILLCFNTRTQPKIVKDTCRLICADLIPRFCTGLPSAYATAFAAHQKELFEIVDQAPIWEVSSFLEIGIEGHAGFIHLLHHLLHAKQRDILSSLLLNTLHNLESQNLSALSSKLLQTITLSLSQANLETVLAHSIGKATGAEKRMLRQTIGRAIVLPTEEATISASRYLNRESTVAINTHKWWNSIETVNSFTLQSRKRILSLSTPTWTRLWDDMTCAELATTPLIGTLIQHYHHSKEKNIVDSMIYHWSQKKRLKESTPVTPHHLLSTLSVRFRRLGIPCALLIAHANQMDRDRLLILNSCEKINYFSVQAAKPAVWIQAHINYLIQHFSDLFNREPAPYIDDVCNSVTCDALSRAAAFGITQRFDQAWTLIEQLAEIITISPRLSREITHKIPPYLSQKDLRILASYSVQRSQLTRTFIQQLCFNATMDVATKATHFPTRPFLLNPGYNSKILFSKNVFSTHDDDGTGAVFSELPSTKLHNWISWFLANPKFLLAIDFNLSLSAEGKDEFYRWVQKNQDPIIGFFPKAISQPLQLTIQAFLKRNEQQTFKRLQEIK